MLPYFLRHYEQFCERIVVYDNGSDDGSQEIVAAHPLCELRHIDTRGEFHEAALVTVKRETWKQSRQKADWVIACDVDELLHHPHLIEFLSECRRSGITMPVPAGWQMVADRFPTTEGQIYDEVHTGFPDTQFSKRAIFNPSAIQEIIYGPGCHEALTKGDVRECADPALRILHFKYLGLEYLSWRYGEYARRLSEFNRAHRFGFQYLWQPEKLAVEFAAYQRQARHVSLRDDEADERRTPGADGR